MVQTKRPLAIEDRLEVSTLREDTDSTPVLGLYGRMTISIAFPPTTMFSLQEVDDYMFSVAAAFVKVKYGVDAWRHPSTRIAEQGVIKVLTHDHEYTTEVMCVRLGITKEQLLNDVREAHAWKPNSFASVRGPVIHFRIITGQIPDKHKSVLLRAWVLPKKPTKV